MNTGESVKILNPANNDDAVVRKRKKKEKRTSTVSSTVDFSFMGFKTLVVACELLPNRKFISNQKSVNA
jgi:hypothetical protein